VSAHRQAAQLRELFQRLDLDPRLRAHLDAALRQAEATEQVHEAVPAGASIARLVEAVTPDERDLLLRLRHWNDPDGYIAALQAGGR
jgi:hypothetical protein